MASILSMENKLKDQKLLAVMQFIHHYDPSVSMQTLFNGQSFVILLNAIPSHQYDFNIKINKNAQKWSEQLQNLQIILLKIQQYFQQVHEKCMQSSDIDLITITKSSEIQQLLKYFQIVMHLLMQSTIKQSFIQTIMSLQESSQMHFVQIIKQSLNNNHRFTKTKYKANNFNRLIAQFQDEKEQLAQQIQRLCKGNTQLFEKCKEYQQIINEMEQDLTLGGRKSSMENSSYCEDNKNNKYLEEFIDKLQNKIVQQGKSYEKQRMNYVDKISQMQNRICKLQQSEELAKIYKEKYDQIMDQMQKMNIWKRQKAKMQKIIEEKDFIVQKLHDRVQQLTQKNITLEQAELQLKLEIEKKNLKIQKMSSQLKKVMGNMGNGFTNKLGQSSILDQTLKQCINIKNMEENTSTNDDEINLIKKQNQKILKKNKQFQKQICKLNKKVQKLRVLQQDKNKLQQLVYQLRITQSEQLNLMFAAFYEGFQANLESSKKLRHAVLNFNQEKPRHARKKTGSNFSGMSKGKQN